MTIIFNKALTLAFFSFFLTELLPSAEAHDFRHPGISLTKEDFELVRKQIATKLTREDEIERLATILDVSRRR